MGVGTGLRDEVSAGDIRGGHPSLAAWWGGVPPGQANYTEPDNE
jgi:hypothetical protein